MTQTCGYYPVMQSEETVENMNEDEFDAGWHYPLPREELHGQYVDLNERLDRMGPNGSIEFWLDRTDRDEEVEATMAIHGTESGAETADEGEADNSADGGVEVTDEDHQEMTGEGENEDEDEADRRTEGEVEATDEDQETTDVAENENEEETDKNTEGKSETADEDYEEMADKSESENEDGGAESSTSSQTPMAE